MNKTLESESAFERRAIFHEIGNTLTSLVANASDLVESEKNSDRKRKLFHVLNESREISRMIKTLRFQDRPCDLDYEPCNPLRASMDIVDELRPLARKKGVHLRASISWNSSIPELGAANRIPLRHLLTNLLLNAIRFTSPGSSITVGIHPEDGSFRITVSDSGPGLPAEINLMARDYSTRRGPGHGTGLAICRTIARRHNIDLSSKNTSNGTTISFSLPVSTTPDESHPTGVRSSPREDILGQASQRMLYA